MIIFDLKCASGHVHEAWFGSSGDFEEQKGRGLVSCPLCGSADIEKAVMAPSVGRKGNSGEAGTSSGLYSSDAEGMKLMLSVLAAEQKRLLETSDLVGPHFADEARAIHLGEAAARSIYGQATRGEALALVEEGIPIASLPFPVVAPSEEN